ncbi:MAG TPA: citrate/2-methylcitrate synthase, partial [Planctomycetota bacterium]|nr:citrate/2-methylcitrate synthase [Planctomycetota bacterium]
MSQDAVAITDLRTNLRYEIPISDGAIPAMELRKIKVSDDDFGLMTYDPAFKNTAACKSRITFIDGDQGILRYRGYPIEELAQHSSFAEVTYLLVTGELPSSSELEGWRAAIRSESHIPERLTTFFESFGEGAHPMGILASALPALGTHYPDSRNVLSPETRHQQIVRLIAKVPILAAAALRRFQGRDLVSPDRDLSYTGNFLRLCFSDGASSWKPHPTLEHALDVLFILHADHEQNCSTSAMRNIGSSRADPYASAGGAVAALWGPLHGGANEAVLRMLEEIGSKEKVPGYIARVKAGEVRLM